MEISNIYNKLNEMCQKAGTDLTNVCKNAGVDRSIVERWKLKDPKTVEILDKLFKSITAAQKVNSKKNRAEKLKKAIKEM